MTKVLKSLIKKTLIAAILVIVTLYFALDFIAAALIKSNIAQKLNSQVKIASVDIGYVPLGISIKGLDIKNMAEDAQWQNMSLNEISVIVNAKSLTTDTIVIDYLLLDSPGVVYNLGELGLVDVAGNVGKKVVTGVLGNAILGPASLGLGIVNMGIDGVKAIKKNSEEKEQKAAEKQAREERGAKKLAIKKLYINDIKLTPSNKVLWLKDGAAINIADIELENIDEDSRDDMLKHIRSIIKKSLLEEITRLKQVAK